MRPWSLAGRLILVILTATVLILPSGPGLAQFGNAVARGDKELRDGHISPARDAYLEALAVQPGDYAVLIRLADLEYKANRPDTAISYIRLAAAGQGWSRDLYRKLADALRAQGQISGALAYYQLSLSGQKDDIPVLRLLANHALAVRDWDGALGYINRLIAIDPLDIPALYQTALLVAPTDPTRAMQYLVKAAADPQFKVDAQHMLAVIDRSRAQDAVSFASAVGIALMEIKAWSYAEHALSLALSQGVSLPVTLAFYGLAQDQQGRDGGTLIESALRSAPTDSTILYAVGLHWRLKGNPDRAIAVLESVMARDPSNAAVAAEIGTIRRSQGQLSEAALWLNMAASLAPTNPEFLTLLATFYADEAYNLQGEGLARLRKLSETLPQSADIAASLGRALFLTGDFDGCHLQLDRALTLDSTSMRAHYYYGIYLEYRSDRAGAIDQYLYVARDVPNNAFQELALRALERLGYQPGQ